MNANPNAGGGSSLTNTQPGDETNIKDDWKTMREN